VSSAQTSASWCDFWYRTGVRIMIEALNASLWSLSERLPRCTLERSEKSKLTRVG